MPVIEQFCFILKTPDFSDFVSRFGYIGILLWFITFDQLTPIPEEVSLLIIGYLSSHGIFNPFVAGVFSLAGFLIVDTAYYFLSKKGSSWIRRRTKGLSRLVKSYETQLKKNTPRAILILCFIPRMRMFAPILAGSMKLSFKRFLLFDTIALVLFTTVYLLIGISFNKSLQKIISKTNGLQNIVFFAAVLVVAIIIIVLVRRRKKA
jgi:membrane protein DedA with SNARE-associated domain